MHIEINVTEIVKYVCLTGISIVAIIFGEKAYREYIHAKHKQKEA